MFVNVILFEIIGLAINVIMIWLQSVYIFITLRKSQYLHESYDLVGYQSILVTLLGKS